MTHGHARTANLIDGDACGARRRPLLERDDRGVGVKTPQHCERLVERREHDDPIDGVRADRIQRGTDRLPIEGPEGDQSRRVAVLARLFRDAVKGDRRTEHGQFETHDADRHGPAAGQSRSGGIAPVPELGDRLLHAFPNIRRDVCRPAHDARDGLLRHAGELGDVDHARTFAAGRRTLTDRALRGRWQRTRRHSLIMPLERHNLREARPLERVQLVGTGALRGADRMAIRPPRPCTCASCSCHPSSMPAKAAHRSR